jgi:hypothetical protein
MSLKPNPTCMPRHTKRFCSCTNIHRHAQITLLPSVYSYQFNQTSTLKVKRPCFKETDVTIVSILHPSHLTTKLIAHSTTYFSTSTVYWAGCISVQWGYGNNYDSKQKCSHYSAWQQKKPILLQRYISEN